MHRVMMVRFWMTVRIALIWFHRRDGTVKIKSRELSGAGHVQLQGYYFVVILPYEVRRTNKVPVLQGSYLCRPLPRRCRAAGACAPPR
jgi:hypothetical protein